MICALNDCSLLQMLLERCPCNPTACGNALYNYKQQLVLFFFRSKLICYSRTNNSGGWIGQLTDILITFSKGRAKRAAVSFFNVKLI